MLALQEILTEHSYELKGGLSLTKSKLKTLKFVEVWEKYSIYGSLLFFCSVVIYIVLKRTRILLYALVWVMSFFNSGGARNSRGVEDQFVLSLPPAVDTYGEIIDRKSDILANEELSDKNFDQATDL